MKRTLAIAIYLVGIPVCVAPAIAAMAQFGFAWSLDGLSLILTNIIGGVVMWWIVAGIGIRLGVFPVEFFGWVSNRLGLGYEAPVPGARRLPERKIPPEGAR
ncbi:MAG: hypothetical protein M3N53_04110 [Actinomycetota bacterium]|nr:hypothetical protein [Actinomycetota bacterium]